MHIGPPVSQRDAAVEKLAKIIPDAAGKSGEDLYNVIADKLKTMDVKVTFSFQGSLLGSLITGFRK